MKLILGFLSRLKLNNNRDWFAAHKEEYIEAKETFEAMINRLIPEIRKFDAEVGQQTAGDCVFRIYRDVRFSGDKSPYKTNMGGFIARGGRKGGFAGYYLHVDPDQSFVAGGNHMPTPDRLKKIRQEILFNVDEFKNILNEPTFRELYGGLEGEQLSRPPKDFPADFPDIGLLKFKSFTVLAPLDIKTLTSIEFEPFVVRAFQALYPLNRFLNRAVDEAL